MLAGNSKPTLISVCRHAKKEENAHVEPYIMSFFGGSGDFHLTLGSGHDDAVLIESWWHRIGV